MEKSIYFDEEGNILYESVGVTASHFFMCKGWYCSKCLKFYFTPWHLKKHASKCSSLFEQDAIILITKDSNENILRIVEELGRMSKRVQGLDTSMSSRGAIKAVDKKVLLYIKNKKPIGIITFCRRKFKNIEKWSAEDFFVLQYMRRQKIGIALFEKMFEYFGINPNNIEAINKNVVFNRPNENMRLFLKSRGLERFYVW